MVDQLLTESRVDRRSLEQRIAQYRHASRINEGEVYDDIHPDDLETALKNELDVELQEAAEDLMSSFDKILYGKLATLVSQAGGSKTTGSALHDELDDFDPDGLMEVQRELVGEVVESLTKYLSQIALLTSHSRLTGVE